MFNIPTVTVASQTLGSAAETITLDYAAPDVSWTPRHLVIRWTARSNEAVSVERGVSLRLNGDTGANYYDQRIDGAVSAVGSGAATGVTSITNIGVDTGNNSAAYGWSSGEFILPDALSTRSHKSVIGFSGAIEQRVRIGTARWANTAAITSISLSQDGSGAFLAGSIVELCVVDESYNINEQILGSAGVLTVSSIAADIGDLVQIGNLKSTQAAISDEYKIKFNTDATATNYNSQYIRGIGSAVAGLSASKSDFGVVTGTHADVPTSAFGAYVGQVTNFSDGSNDRIFTGLSGTIYNAWSNYAQVKITTIRWNNTAAITTVQLENTYAANWSTGSMLSTYAVPKNLIERQELSGTASSVTFSSIPQTYDHLELSIYVRGDSSGQPEAGFKNEFNGDTTVANYKRQLIIASGTTVGAGQEAKNEPVDFPTSTATANVFGSIAYSIQNYTKTDRHKHYMVTAGDAGENELRLTSNRWANTAAISAIVFTPSAGNFITGSVFTLRGINAPAATGTSDVAKLNGIEPSDIAEVN